MILLGGFLVWRIDLLWWCHEVFLVCISVAAEPSAAITEETDIHTKVGFPRHKKTALLISEKAPFPSEQQTELTSRLKRYGKSAAQTDAGSATR